MAQMTDILKNPEYQEAVPNIETKVDPNVVYAEVGDVIGEYVPTGEKIYATQRVRLLDPPIPPDLEAVLPKPYQFEDLSGEEFSRGFGDNVALGTDYGNESPFVEVTIRRKVCKIYFDPDGLTPALLKKVAGIQDIQGGSDSINAVIPMLDDILGIVVDLTISWDVPDKHGHIVPLDVEAIAEKVSFNSLIALMTALTGEILPGEVSASASSPVSPQDDSAAS